MLQQNFMSAADLGISEDWHIGLIKVLGMLERGEITHTRTDSNDCVKRALPMMFNMNFWQIDVSARDNADECGTLYCIGGWVEKIMGKLSHRSWTDEVSELFYPGDTFEPSSRFYQSITVEQAAHATRNYLTHGSPEWEEVLTKEQRKRRGG